jgi:hypothetical protein
MLTTVIPSKRGGRLLKLNDETRRRIETLGSSAEELLQGQDVALWERAADAGFLIMINQGAKILRHLEIYANIELADADAQKAFVTCRLLSMRACEFPPRDRRTLRQALIILAKCCSFQIRPQLLPTFRKLPAAIKGNSRTARAYRSFLRKEDVSLLDLLRLRRWLERVPSPEFVPLNCALREMTEGLEKALEGTRSASLLE